ncbi:MAG: hypothetical protein R3311_21855, partial [Oceanisphaera sp.]|nr:hypothetical protein [Oceanisphaera sp.]
LTDLTVPLPLALPRSIAGNWLLALGPDFSLPTGTDDDLSKEQFTLGVTAIVGYLTKGWMVGCYPQYYWGIADFDRGDDQDYASFGNMFYWLWINVREDIQLGFSPTITYDAEAKPGNRWNVPVGFGFSKMTNWGDLPVRLEVAVEYSVVNEDAFGQECLFKFDFMPIIPKPIKKPIFGGKKPKEVATRW